MHAVAPVEVEGILSMARFELVNIQHVQASLDLEPWVKDKEEPDLPTMPIPKAWKDTLGWETKDDDEGISELTFSNHTSFPPLDEQLESAREVIADFE